MSRTLMPSLAAKAVNYTLLTWIALIFIFPIVFMIVSSLKPDLQLLQDSSSLRAFLPVGDISFDNYSAAFQRVPIARFIFNSVLVTAVTMVLSLAVCSMAAFAFVFLEFPGKNAMLAVVLATFIVPFESIAIPDLADHCTAAGLAKQKIPEQLLIVDELPRNPLGKVLKHVLRKQLTPES